MERKVRKPVIIGFSKHGRGRAADAVGYITEGAEAVGYASGGRKSGKVRDPAPVIVRGDPEVIRRVIDTVPYEWKYTSAMFSFSPEERITPEMEQRIMNEFERCAFAGLDRGRYCTLWVRHTDSRCHHLHFVAPRIDLRSGRSLNIAPPGKASRELFETLRTKLNAELGLSDPEDPDRVQSVRLPRHIAKLRARDRNLEKANEDVRIAVTRHLEAKTREGHIKGRGDVVRQLTEAGLAVRREGKDYITIEHPENGTRLRLRGGLYDRLECLRVIPGIRDNPSFSAARSPGEIGRLEAKLQRLVGARARHHRERYGPNLEANDSESKERLLYDRSGKQTFGHRKGNGRKTPPKAQRDERAIDGFDKAASGLERAASDLVRSSRGLERGIERERGRQKERELDRRLIETYGAPTFGGDRASREREIDRELNDDFR